ncbi:hypothetical protein Tco_1184724 [Tanacetum coccineum]
MVVEGSRLNHKDDKEAGSDLARIGSYSGSGTFFLHQVNFVEDSCTRNKEYALTLSWERIPRLASGVRNTTVGDRAMKAAFGQVPYTDATHSRVRGPVSKLGITGSDTIQLEDAVSTISQEYLLEFSSEYFIPENLYPELPGPEDHIVDFPEGKIGVYTKNFKFANFRILISQFIFDILGYYNSPFAISEIGASKIANYEINLRVLYNLHRELFLYLRAVYIRGWCFSKGDRTHTHNAIEPLDSLKIGYNASSGVDEQVFPTVVAWRRRPKRWTTPQAHTTPWWMWRHLNTTYPIPKKPKEFYV